VDVVRAADISTSKVKIYLADLFHEQFSVLDVVPLNIGYIAAALSEVFKDQVEYKLFKYPDKLLKQLEYEKPDIMAFSNYTWNHNLSLHYASIVKKIYPEVIVVMGGPNIRLDKNGISSFLREYPYVDVYIPLEGEIPFCNLVKTMVKNRRPVSISEHYKVSGDIRGCFLNVEGYDFAFLSKEDAEGSLDFGSPYLKGILDEFILDANLIPIFEVVRGCPYKCTFCFWGMSSLKKLRVRDMELVKEEFRYVGLSGAKQETWFFADANFGILPHYLEIAQEVKAINETYGYPKRLGMNYPKVSSEMTMDIIDILKDMFPAQIAVQSFDSKVIKAIKRKNIQKTQINELIKRYHDKGLIVSTDILFVCSAETLQSHYDTLMTCFNLDYDIVSINNIRMLPGTEIEQDESRKKYGFETKYRFIPNSYGKYDGKFVFEIEEAIVASNTMTEKEMNELKTLHFLIQFLWNSSFAINILRIGNDYGFNPVDVILNIQQTKSNHEVAEILNSLRWESEKEWFSSEESLMQFYSRPGNYQHLFGEEPSEKLIWKYFAIFYYKKGLIAGLINLILEELLNRTSVDRGLLNIAAKLSLDRVRQDLRDDKNLQKVNHYKVNKEHYVYLKNKKIIPQLTEYSNGGFALLYTYNESDLVFINNLFNRFRYDKQPIQAISRSLGYGLISMLTYKVGVPSALERKETALI
jgi:radical SAM superfamily enzyme YgiQ (UPF0313 family)